MSLALWLRAGRAQRGLTLEDVSRVTKIQTRILERLEGGKPDGLPADVFVRGFVRSFAKCVGLDEAEALRRYGACGVASAPTVAVRAMVEAMADLAPATARSMPSGARPPLASGSLPDLPKSEPTELLDPPPPLEAVALAPSVAEAAPAEAPAAAVAPDLAVAPAAAAPAPAAAVVATAPAAAEGMASAEAVAADAAPATTKKKRTRRTAAAVGSGAGKGRGKRKALAIGTPAEASPVVAAEGAPAGAQPEAAVMLEGAAAASDAPAATGEAIPAAAATGEVIPAAAATGEVISASATTGEAIPASAATGEAIPASAATGEAIPASAATGEAIPAAPILDATPTQAATAPDPWGATPALEPAEGSFEEPIATATWRPKMPPAATQSLPPWRRPRHAATSVPVVPSLVIDDADPDGAEQLLEERAAAQSVMTAAQRRSFLPPILLDREDRSARQGGLTLAVIILLIAATLTLSYLMRRPSSSGDGVTQRAAPAQMIG